MKFKLKVYKIVGRIGVKNLKGFAVNKSKLT